MQYVVQQYKIPIHKKQGSQKGSLYLPKLIFTQILEPYTESNGK